MAASVDKRNRIGRWYFGGLASAGAACCTHPLDLLKVTARPIFKRVTASKPTDGSASVKDTQPAQQQSPPKRIISKKALLSRQPLSGQRSSGSGRKKDTLKTSSQSSTDKAETPGTSKAASSPADFLGHQRVSRVTIDNVNSAKPKTSFTTDSFSSTKAVTNTWTGSTLGSDSRNAGSVQRMAQQPIVSISAGPVQQGAGTTITVPQQKHAAEHGAGNTEETANPDAVRADVLPTLAKLGKTNSLVVSSRQRGNPLLNFVRNVPWEFGNIVPDYVMGQSNCALFLSLRYHQLNPEYIHDRLKLLGRSFDLRVLLVQVDIKDPHHLLKDLAKICILADCTLMLAFSAEEAGRYLETYKVYENKAAEAIMERTDSSFGVQLSDCLNRVKSVNKTDCSTLLATFGSLQGIMRASTEDLSLCPGFGPQKAKRLHDVFREPFLVSKKQRGDAGK